MLQSRSKTKPRPNFVTAQPFQDTHPLAGEEGLERPACVVVVDPFHAGESLVSAALDQNCAVVVIFTLDKNFCVAECSDFDALRANPNVEILFANTCDAISGLFGDTGKWAATAVMAGSEPGVVLATHLAARLGLPGNDVEMIAAGRNKHEMRKVVAAAGLASPRFQLCTDPSDADSFCREVGFPIVLKTPQGAGTNLVRKCHSLAEANWAFNEIRTTRDLFGQTADAVVAEEFIGGDEYAINLFHDGEQIHVVDAWKYDKFDTDFASNLYRSIILCDFRTDAVAGVGDYAIQVARAVGLRLGYAHCEVKLCPKREQPILIEIGLRQPGAGLTEHCRTNTAFDPYRSTLRVFQNGGAPIDARNLAYRKICATLFGAVVKAGALVDIQGLRQVESLPSYLSHAMSVSVGDRLQLTRDMTGIPWSVRLAHESREQLLEDVEAVHRTIKFVVQE